MILSTITRLSMIRKSVLSTPRFVNRFFGFVHHDNYLLFDAIVDRGYLNTFDSRRKHAFNDFH